MELTEEKSLVEEKGKKVIFGNLDELILVYEQKIAEIHGLQNFMNIDIDLPNIGVTLKNKITELSNEFEQKDTSLFVSVIENYGAEGKSTIMTSFIGDAIIMHLLSIGTQGISILRKIFDIILEARDKNANNKLKPTNQFSKFFAKLRKFFMPKIQEKNLYDQEEKEISIYIDEFRNLNDKIDNYNLRENLINVLVNKIKEKQVSINALPTIVKMFIFPDLEKLEMIDLIPEIDNCLKKEYEKNNLNSEIKENVKESV